MALLRIRLRDAALLFVGASLVARSAVADIPPPPSTKTPAPADAATAKKHFDTGLKLYGEGAYPEALVAFEASYRLGGRPSALKNIAQCHRNLKHFVDAYEAYDQLLTSHKDMLAPPERKAIEQALEELSILTGTLSVSVSEADAEIEIDGKPSGRSPLARAIRTSVGAHKVRVSKAGFEPVEQTVNVASQEAKKVDVSLAAEQKAGHVVVREPLGREVHVIIDGEDKGPAPWEGDVAAGEHTIEAKGPLFAAAPHKVTVVAKQRLDVTVDAQPLTGHLRVTTIPVSAKITIDKREAGTGVWEGDLPAGTHRIEASLPGQPPQIREVKLTRGQNVVQEIPIVGAIGTGASDYKGIYVSLTLDPMFLVDGFTSNRVQNLPIPASERWDVAGSSTLRGGYSFGWISAELVGSFMFEYREQRQTLVQAGRGEARIQDVTTSPNVFLGVGPRVTSKDDLIRFTFGIAPGLALRNFTFKRETNLLPASAAGGTRSQEFTADYTAFALNLEAGILLGSTPGAKFFVGAHAWLDFPDDVIVGPETISGLTDAAFRSPGRGVTVISGTQFFFGPVFGVRIGQ